MTDHGEPENEVSTPITTAGRRWADDLQAWAIPQHILDQVPTSPYVHDTASFAVDDTLDRDVRSAQVARHVLPRTGGSVLDIGCGGGRAAMSLAPPAERVIGIDQDPEMLAAFTAAAAEAGVRSATIQGTWPAVGAETPIADVVTCHHVAYNVADIEPFLLELTAHARLAVVVVLPTVHPLAAWNDAWQHFWGLQRPAGPTSDDLVDLLSELGIRPERWEMPRPPLARHTSDPASRVPAALRRLCLGADRADDVVEWFVDHEPQWAEVHTVLRWPGTGA